MKPLHPLWLVLFMSVLVLTAFRTWDEHSHAPTVLEQQEPTPTVNPFELIFATRSPEELGNADTPPATPTPTPLPLANVITNGDFEIDGPRIGVAPYWQGYDNGNAHFSWYDEEWTEAVYSGKHSQLMEIYEFYGNETDRVMAIHQTAKVRPHTDYQLTFFALMRTDAAFPDRNQGHYQMDWGIDYGGNGDYNAISLSDGWREIELTEQAYYGSQSESSDDAEYLRFTKVQTNIAVGESSRITLFIRAMKKVRDGREANFNVDNVSLIGPAPLGGSRTTSQGQTPPEIQAISGGLPDAGGQPNLPFGWGLVGLGAVLLLTLVGYSVVNFWVVTEPNVAKQR